VASLEVKVNDNVASLEVNPSVPSAAVIVIVLYHKFHYLFASSTLLSTICHALPTQRVRRARYLLSPENESLVKYRLECLYYKTAQFN